MELKDIFVVQAEGGTSYKYWLVREDENHHRIYSVETGEDWGLRSYVNIKTWLADGSWVYALPDEFQFHFDAQRDTLYTAKREGNTYHVTWDGAKWPAEYSVDNAVEFANKGFGLWNLVHGAVAAEEPVQVEPKVQVTGAADISIREMVQFVRQHSATMAINYDEVTFKFTFNVDDSDGIRKFIEAVNGAV